MLLTGNELHHVSTVAHQGKILLFGVGPDRAIHYRVKHEPPNESVAGYLLTAAGLSRLQRALKEQGLDLAGRLDPLVNQRFADEDAYLGAVARKIGDADARKFTGELLAHARLVDLTHWTDWQLLPLPHEAADDSVLARERAEGLDGLVASVYDSHKRSALAPVQAVSAGAHLHVFRQSEAGTLLVDRFVLDGATGRLSRALEVRFKRSGKRHTPLRGANARELDSRDFRDSNGEFFREPSVELRLVSGVEAGRFAVALTPTHEHDKFRWHVFTWDAAGKQLRIVTLRKTEDSLFDLRDWTAVEGDAESPSYRTIPGIVRRSVELRDAEGRVLEPCGGICAAVHDLQREIAGDDGEKHLVKVERRVFVAVPTGPDGKIAAFSFGLARDGSLAAIDPTHHDTLLVEHNEALQLPADVLARLESWRDATCEAPPPEPPRAGLVFDGGQQHVATRSAVALADTSFTIELWTRRNLGGRLEIAVAQGVPEQGRGLTIGHNGDQFRIGFHGSELDTPHFADRDWHHWACVVEQGGPRRIYRDGVLVAEDRPALRYAGSGELIVGRTPWGYAFAGEIADVRVWRRARTEAEIKATMHHRLTGRELGLVAHWPLDAIVDGTVHNTASPTPGVVVGGAYRSGRALARTLADGVTLVDRYRNPTLVPIAERATYIESFELKSEGSRLGFDVVFWGETVAGETTAPVGVPVQLEPLPDGWIRASARFTAQPGMTRLRALEFAMPGGTWQPLEIRNHRIEQLRGTITESTHVEAVTLTELAPEFAGLLRIEREIDALEAKEVELYRRLRPLDDALAGSSDELAAEVARKQQALAAAEQQVAARDAERVLFEQHLTYSSTVALVATNSAYQAYVCVEGTAVHANRGAAGPWEFLAIQDAFNPERTGVIRYGDWVAFRAHTGKYLIADNPSWPATHYYWVGAVYPHIGAYERFQIVNPDNPGDTGPVRHGGKVAFKTWRSDHGHKFILCGTGGPWWQKLWCEHDGIHADGRFRVDNVAEGPAVEGARVRYGEALAHRERCRAELAAAQQALDSVNRDRAGTQAERDRVAAALVAHQAVLSAAVTEHLAAVRELDDLDTTMPRLNDPAGPLGVQGALLGFARTHASPTALESLEGAVHLYFAGAEGRLRRCDYDAVSRRWHADTPGACLRLRGDGHVTIPHHPAFTSETVTIEMWVRWHGSGSEIHFFTGKGIEELEVHAGGEVPGGLRFIPVAGVYVDTAPGALPPGEWVHVACVYAGEPGTAEIYLDGKLATHRRTDAKKPRQPTSAPLLLGRRQNNTCPLSGDMAEIRLWNVALTRDEIAAHMHLPLSGREPGLVGHWPLREGDGALAHDRSVNGQHGTITAGRWHPSTAPIGRPSTSSAAILEFTRAGVVTIPHSPAQRSPAFTLEMWFRWTGSGADIDFLFGKGLGELELHTGGAIPGGLRFMPVPGRYVDSPTDVLRPGTWVHVACVYTGDPSQSRIHLDGVALACNLSHDGIDRPPSDAPLHIGRRVDQYYPFSGQIAEVALWSVALSPADIVARVNRPLTGREPGLVGYWPLDDGSGARVVDRSPAGNHGTIAGPRFVAGAVRRGFATGSVLAGEYGSLEGGEAQREALLRRVVAWPVPGGVEVLLGQRVDGLELRWLGNAQMNPTLVGYIEGPPPVPGENLTVEDDYNGCSSVEFRISEEATSTFKHELETGLGLSAAASIGTGGTAEVGASFLVSGALEIDWKAVLKAKLDLATAFHHEYSSTDTVTTMTSEALSLKGEKIGARFVPKNVGYATVVSTLADVFALRTRGGKRMVGYRIAPVKDVPPDVNVVTFMINPAYTLAGSLDGQIGTAAADDRFYGHVPEARAQHGSEVAASYYRLREAYALKDAIDRANRRAEALALNFRTDLLDGVTRPSGGGGGSSDEIRGQAQTKAGATIGQANALQQKITARRELDKVVSEAPKGNIVNSYVWDGDGGLRVQTQSFATSWEHVFGGSISAEVGLGVELAFEGGVAVEFEGMLGFKLSEKLSGGMGGSRAIELNVSVECERRGITDNRDRPLTAGEKVDRYRFMSFALQPATDHFTDFFARVVDPEWLASDDEEALVLRRIDQGTPNKTWRVLHRVTYVERPTRVGED